MDVRLHHDVAEFTALTRPLLAADPVRHSVVLTVLALLLRVPEGDEGSPVLLSVHRDGVLAGGAVCTPPRELLVSAPPANCAGATVEVLASRYPRLPGAVGPRGEAEAFAQSWAARTGASVHERMAQRVFALHRLTPPDGVPGVPRRAGAGDLELLSQWRQDFADEATGGLRGHGTALQQIRRSLAAGSAAVLWEAGGQSRAWASASAPVAGMSRIGPVYTPPQYRGHGYGGAVTAAAARWAQQAHAKHVVLSTDLANPISNAIYPRIGFRPMHDAVEIAFTPAPRRCRIRSGSFSASCRQTAASLAKVTTRLLVLQPSEVDPPERLGDWLTDAGAHLRVCRPATDGVPQSLDAVDGVVCMGGEMGAHDDADHPWLAALRWLLAGAVARRLPVLGVCLGGQLLAAATGGTVRRSVDGPEAGTLLVAKRDAAAHDPLFVQLPLTPDVIQFHHDEIHRLPPGATLLASSPRHANQAFRVGTAGYGLQFHIETSPATVLSWAGRDAADVFPARQLDPDHLERVHADIAEAWQPLAARFVALAAGELAPAGDRLALLLGH